MKKSFYRSLAMFLVIGLSATAGNAIASEQAKSTAAGSAAEAHVPGSLTGTVLETMDSGGYTYLQLDTGIDKPWIAIPKAKVTVGEKVTCQPGMVMKNFSSKTLNRTFDSIVFSAGLGGAAANPHGSMGAMKSPHAKMNTGSAGGADSFASAVAAEGGHSPSASQMQAAGSGGSLGAIAPFSEINVDKATGENGQRVGDVFTNKEKLNGKTIQVKGQVVKFSPMIMGRNWVHLQDGTGDPMQNTHDLVVTTDATVKEGDIIVMEGVVAAKKDFGAGYKYEAIVEKAKVIQ